MTIGYDLDGIIANEGPVLDWLFDHFPAWAVRLRDSRFNKCIGWPNFPGLIVTGRPIQDSISTTRWLHYQGIAMPVIHTEYVTDLHLMKKTDFVSFSTLAKIEVCKRNELHIFVESDESVRQEMAYELPFVAILSREEALQNGFLQPSVPWARPIGRTTNEKPSATPEDTGKAV